MGGEFFKEEPTSGLARCKGEGYVAIGAQPGEVTRKLKNGETVNLYKKK